LGKYNIRAVKGETKMKRTLIFVLFGFVTGYLLHSARTTSSAQVPEPRAPHQSRQKIQAATDFFSDLGKGRWGASAPYFNKVDWVDKQCRTWAQDGDIDVDQTCLVVKSVNGSVSIIPNPYNDAWQAEGFAELAKPLATKDKWIKRFLEVRGW
jgi:hypothetical protein